MSTGKTVLGLATGVAIGAVLGVLFAPAKGSETRSRLMGYADDISDFVDESVENFKSKGINMTRLKGHWNEVKGKLKQQFSALTDIDLNYVEGKEEELLGRLQQKLGKTKDEIIEIINNFLKPQQQTQTSGR
jgi:uncharacterized protein YjbJ (UPF0337 family)